MSDYPIEDLIKAKKQYELAVELLEIAIEEQKSDDLESREMEHIIQASECASEGTKMI